MNFKIDDLTPKTLNSTSELEPIHQIVKAILEGKYSWACVLILRFYGYNPLHYIPYRTYQRLLKQNRYNIENAEYLGSQELDDQVDEVTENCPTSSIEGHHRIEC